MYHVIQVGMNSNAIKQIDDLRKAFPNVYNREDLLLRLVAEAHAKLDNNKQPALKLVA